ncbi:SDR family NAD(P)-dependent oxidoreductase [Sphingomonas profundi]|uniref:SDR family NAD(P)-dependent oxidoreductase n=1 Tax=Alterirhizorhabdus profundi TaxID=2681549 RepID=UPI0018D00153|nr:SDR family NAD(P)-dependent oxidoreductase [Sphingomonas profundi]
MTKKVALVTGCGKQDGIGAAIARKLAAAGCALVVVDVEATGVRDSHEPAGAAAAGWRGVESLVEELGAAGAEASFVTGDISSETDVARIVAHARSAHGSLDILVNNAGAPFSMGHGDVETVEPDAFDRVMSINVRGTFLMGRAAAGIMRANRWGRIVNVASVAGRQGSRLNSAYAASKAGVIALAQTWALELGPDGVTCNSVLPGLIITSRTLSGYAKKTGSADADMETVRKAMGVPPVGRAGTPEDVAEAVAYLASEGAGFVNGQSLIIDGGAYRI